MSSYKGTITLSNIFQKDATLDHITSTSLRTSSPYLFLNDGLTNTYAGIVNVYNTGLANGSILSNFTSNTVSVTTGLSLGVAKLVLIKGTPNNINDGVYEILTYVSISGLLTINTSPLESFAKSAFTPTSTFSGTITNVGVNVLKSTSTSNGLLIGIGNTSPLTYGTAAIILPPYVITNILTSTYTILGTEDVLAVRYTATGQCTLTLPNVSTLFRVTIVDEGGNAFANNIIIIPSDSSLIMGSSSWVMNRNYGTIRLYSNGTNWFAS